MYSSLESENTLHVVSTTDGATGEPTQTIYIKYGGSLPAEAQLFQNSEMYGRQFVLQTDDSDILASLFSSEIALDQSCSTGTTLLDTSAGATLLDTGAMLLDDGKDIMQATFSKENLPLAHEEVITDVDSGMVDISNESFVDKNRSILCSSAVLPSGYVIVNEKIQHSSSLDEASIKPFSFIQATLSDSLMATIDGSQSVSLQKAIEDCCLQMVHDPCSDSYHVIGYEIESFGQLERTFSNKFCNVSTSVSISTNTDPEPERLDKSVSCQILNSQYTRSGREVKKRIICWNADEEREVPDQSVLYVPAQTGSVVANKPEPVDSSSKKKRGRPRKVLKTVDGDNAVTKESTASIVKESTASVVKEPIASVVEAPTVSIVDRSTASCVEDWSLPILNQNQISERTVLNLSKQVNNSDRSRPFSSQHTSAKISLKKEYEMRTPFKFFCHVCSFKTKRESHLLKHLKLHDRNLPLLCCSQCSYRTTRINHLRRHEIVHKSYVLFCSEPKCTYRSDSRKLLLRHIRIRHGNKTPSSDRLVQSCPIASCSYKTSVPSMLRRHRARHINNGKLVDHYKCDQCDYETKSHEGFLRHVSAVHGNNRRFLCDICGRGFNRADALSQHGMIHLDKASRSYPYECGTCQKKFQTQSHLVDHTARHSLERSFLCEICGAAFKTRSVQQKHVKTIHTNPSFSCASCSATFATNYALRRHSTIHNRQNKSQPKQAPVAETTSVTVVQLPTLNNLIKALVWKPVEQNNKTEGLTEQTTLFLTSNLL